MSRRISFQALAATAAALALAPVLAPAAIEAKTMAHTASVTIKVTAVDFKFKLSSHSARPGKVTFKITNKGAVSHDLKINGVTSKLISPGKSTSITVNFKKKGSYYYKCTVPGHAALGMKGYFKITRESTARPDQPRRDLGECALIHGLALGHARVALGARLADRSVASAAWIARRSMTAITRAQGAWHQMWAPVDPRSRWLAWSTWIIRSPRCSVASLLERSCRPSM